MSISKTLQLPFPAIQFHGVPVNAVLRGGLDAVRDSIDHLDDTQATPAHRTGMHHFVHAFDSAIAVMADGSTEPRGNLKVEANADCAVTDDGSISTVKWHIALMPIVAKFVDDSTKGDEVVEG